MKLIEQTNRTCVLNYNKILLLAVVLALFQWVGLEQAAAVDWANDVQAATSGASGSASGDLDNDGDAEFVDAVSDSGGGSPRFRIYNHNGSGFTTYDVLTPSQVASRRDRFGGDIELADLNNDGYLDIIVPNSDNAGTNGNLSWFENPGGNLGGNWTEHNISNWNNSGTGDAATHMSDLISGDINGDGWTDIVVRDISHGFWVFIRQSSGNGWQNRKFVPCNPREGLALWDPDDDGDLDILINGVWFETPSNPVTGTYTQHAIPGAELWYPPNSNNLNVREFAAQVEVGDFNGDGREDFVITNAEELSHSTQHNKPDGIQVFLAPADPINGTWTKVVVSSQYWSWHNCEIGDLDNDGDLDFISGIAPFSTNTASARIRAFLNNGSGTSFTEENVDNVFMYQGSIGDADGDGDLDIWAPNHFNSGAVRYYANLEGGSSPNPPAAPSNLDVTGLGSSQVNLTWDDNANNESGFKVERRTGAGSYSQIGTAGANSTVFLDATVNPDATYTYRVRATNSAGDSGYSNELTVTTPSGNFDAYSQIEAEDFTSQSGLGIYSGGTGQKIGSIENGTWAAYADVDFGDGPVSFTVSAASNTNGGTIELRLGSPTGTLIGSATVNGTSGWNNFAEAEASVSGASGVHDLYLVFTGGSGALLDVDYFQFSETPSGGGGEGNFDAFSTIEAEEYTSQSGLGIYSGGTGQKIGSIENGTWASYEGVDFGDGAVSFSASAASNSSGGTIELRLGSTTGTLVGSVIVPGTGGWNNFTAVESAITEVSGVHDLYLVFTGGSGSLLDVDYFQFSETTSGGGGGGGGNLAAGQPVTVSSTGGSNVASNAVDENGNTRWSSTYSDNQWIYVDLGESYSIERVVLDWETAYASEYRIEVSTDTVNWTQIFYTDMGQGNVEDINGLSGSGRYVRIYCIDRATSWGNSLWEIEVYAAE